MSVTLVSFNSLLEYDHEKQTYICQFITIGLSHQQAVNLYDELIKCKKIIVEGRLGCFIAYIYIKSTQWKVVAFAMICHLLDFIKKNYIQNLNNLCKMSVQFPFAYVFLKDYICY